MIARDGGLDHRRVAFGAQPGQQQRRLELRARDRHFIADTVQGHPTGNSHRRPSVAGVDRRTHRAEWHCNAFHWPAHQRLVADQHRIECLRTEQPHEEPHRGAGIAHVERCGRRPKAIEACAFDNDLARPWPPDLHAQRGHGAHRGEAILALEKSADARGARRNGAEHQCPMRDRLVTRNRSLTSDAGSRRHLVAGHRQSTAFG